MTRDHVGGRLSGHRRWRRAGRPDLRRSRFVALIGAMSGSDPALFAAWVVLSVLRVVLPTVFAVLLGAAAGAMARHGVWQPAVLAAVAAAVLTQVLPPVHVAISQNLGR